MRQGGTYILLHGVAWGVFYYMVQQGSILLHGAAPDCISIKSGQHLHLRRRDATGDAGVSPEVKSFRNGVRLTIVSGQHLHLRRRDVPDLSGCTTCVPSGVSDEIRGAAWRPHLLCRGAAWRTHLLCHRAIWIPHLL